jgi:hypothetical protein
MNSSLVGMNRTMLKKDLYVFGFGLGILTPVALFALIYGLNYLLVLMGIAHFYLDLQTHLFISLFGNLLPIRYYFVNLTYDKTGRGILFVTFVIVLLFFGFKDLLFERL